MAITQSALVDVLFKKVVASKATTDTKYQYFEESFNSRLNTFSTDVWSLSDLIPNQAATVSGVVERVSATLSYVVGSNGAFRDTTGILRDLIPFNYGDGLSYEYQILQNNGSTTISKGDPDWLLDPISGILTFFNGATGGTVTGAAGTIASQTSPPIVRAWKYLGPKGIIPRLSGLSYSGGTLSSPLSLLAAGRGLTYTAYTFSILLATVSSGLTFSSDGGLRTVLNLQIGDGLTFSTSTYSTDTPLAVWLKETNPGLTFGSDKKLRLLDSLVLTPTEVILSGTVLGKYTIQPTTLVGWNDLSIPTKGYVDSVASGLSLKQSVRVAATGPVNISSAPSQIDGVTLSFGDRILLWQQDGTVNGTISNGIYSFSASSQPLTRSSDLDGIPQTEVTPGVYTFVTDGSTYRGNGFVIVNVATESSIQVGTQSMRWTQFSSAGNYSWGEGLISSGQNIDVDILSKGGLTFSQSKLKIDLDSNSGLIVSTLSGVLSINPNSVRYGLTFSSGVLDVFNPIVIGLGLTDSSGSNYLGRTYGVLLSTNSGLTFSFNTSSTTYGGLSIDYSIMKGGLTFSGGSMSLLVGYGLTISGENYLTNGLTFGDGFNFVEISGNMTYSHKLQPVLDNSAGLKFDYGSTPSKITIDWPSLMGNGLTYSGGAISSAGGLQKYTETRGFSASVPTYVTHSLGNSDILIQMYDSTTDDQVLARYGTRTINDVLVTTSEDVTARIIILG